MRIFTNQSKNWKCEQIKLVASELNIPIDIIGGTSAGAIIGSQIALGTPLEKIIERNKVVNKLNMFKEYGFPYISLIKSKKIEYAAKLSAQNRDIEDLWIPFFDRLEKHLPISFAKYYLFVVTFNPLTNIQCFILFGRHLGFCT